MPAEGRPMTRAEHEEFDLRRATSGLDSKEGLNVYVVSGSVVGGGGTGGGDPTTVRSGTIALYGSGFGQLSVGGSLDTSKLPLHVLVASGSVVGSASVSVDSGLHVMISGQVVVAKVSGETVISKVSGETVVARVSGETVIAKVSGETVIARVSGQEVFAGTTVAGVVDGETNAIPFWRDAGTNIVHIAVRPQVFDGSNEWDRLRGVRGLSGIYQSGMPNAVAVGILSGFSVVKVSGETVIAKVSGETVVARASGELVRLATSGMPAITSKSGSLDPNTVPLHVLVVSGSIAGTGGGGDPTTIRSGTVSLYASGMGLLTAKSGSLDPNTIPLHVLVVSGSIAGTASVSVDSGLHVMISGQVVVAKVSGETVIARVSGQIIQQAVLDVSFSDSFSNTEATVTNASGSIVAHVAFPFAIQDAAGTTWDRLRTTQAVGLSGLGGAGARGMLAVGFSGGTVISKASGETGYLAASGMGPITARSGSLEPTFNPLHVLVVSGSVAGTGGGDPTSVRSGTIALFASGMGQLTAKSGALDPNTSPLHVLVVSGSIAGTASVSVDSGLHVMISGQSVVAKVSGETVISKVSGETVVAKVSGETVVAKVSGETIVVSISGQQVEAHVQSGAIELYASGMGRITAKSGSLEPTFTPLHVLVVSGSVAGTGGGDPTTVRSGTIALFASGMGLLTSKSGSLDPNANPLHVFVVSGSVLGTATAGDPTTVRSGTTALFASGMGLLTAKSGSLDPNANPLHVLVVSGSVVGGGGGATTTTLSGSEMSIAQFLPFLTSGEENQGLAVSGDISFIRKDVKGMAVVRIDRTHISGMYARYEPVTITAAGDTVLETPGSGRSLRLKLIQDSYLGNSGSIVVGYKFGSGTPLMFRHQVTANVPNWGMNLVGANVQGSVNVPLIANANLATSSGLGVTYVVEEVGSGAVF